MIIENQKSLSQHFPLIMLKKDYINNILPSVALNEDEIGRKKSHLWRILMRNLYLWI